MPELERIIRAETAEPLSPAVVRETRFDQAHEIQRANTKTPPLEIQSGSENISASTEVRSHDASGELFNSPTGTRFENEASVTPELIQQFRLQAQQLANYLDSRQRDLDRREAELHARIAQQESAARNARLWFQERNSELDDRQQALEQREQEFNVRLIESNEEAESQRAAIIASEARTQNDIRVLRDVDLQQRQDELNEQSLQIDQRLHHCQSYEQNLKEREAQLEAAEAALARSQVEWDEGRQQEHQRRSEIQARLEEQQKKTVEGQRRIEIELQTERETLQGRSQQLERRSAALDQMRGDLLRVQRETLEMRLATEELWAQMSSVAPAAALTQSLARLRAQLTEYYRLQAIEAETQRREAEQLTAAVVKQHQQLLAQKQEWQQFAGVEQRQIELQASRLAAREEELNRQQERQYHAQQELETERRRLEMENRRLQSELRRHTEGAAKHSR
jgi:hypothetical protein